MRSRHLHALVASILALGAARAVADDPTQQAHAIMREALLERAMRLPAAIATSGAAQSATTMAREHMDRTRRSEAERAAHQRAVEHGAMRSGAGRPGREMRGPDAGMHGGNSNGSWGMDCQDATNNWRMKDVHPQWMPGGGMGMGATPSGASPSTAGGMSSQVPDHVSGH